MSRMVEYDLFRKISVMIVTRVNNEIYSTDALPDDYLAFKDSIEVINEDERNVI